MGKRVIKRKKITFEKYDKLMEKVIKDNPKAEVQDILMKMLDVAGQYDLEIGGVVKKSHKEGKVKVIDKFDLNEISLCKKCHCMTKTIKNKCGKCKAKK